MNRLHRRRLPGLTYYAFALCLVSSCVPASAQSQQTLVVGGKATNAGSTSSYASTNTPAGATPSSPVDGDDSYDSTQGAEAFRQSTNTTVFRGGVVSGCVNVTPVTASMNTTSGQNLMSCTIPAGLLNTLGKTLRAWIAGFYTTPVGAAGGTITMSVQLGGSDICKRTPQTSYVASSTNNPWDLSCYIATQTAGASGKFEAQGMYTVVTSASQTAIAGPFPILNTATVPTGTVDTTAAQTLQIVVTFSTNQAAANSATERQLVVEVLN